MPLVAEPSKLAMHRDQPGVNAPSQSWDWFRSWGFCQCRNASLLPSGDHTASRYITPEVSDGVANTCLGLEPSGRGHKQNVSSLRRAIFQQEGQGASLRRYRDACDIQKMVWPPDGVIGVEPENFP